MHYFFFQPCLDKENVKRILEALDSKAEETNKPLFV